MKTRRARKKRKWQRKKRKKSQLKMEIPLLKKEKITIIVMIGHQLNQLRSREVLPISMPKTRERRQKKKQRKITKKSQPKREKLFGKVVHCSSHQQDNPDPSWEMSTALSYQWTDRLRKSPGLRDWPSLTGAWGNILNTRALGRRRRSCKGIRM